MLDEILEILLRPVIQRVEVLMATVNDLKDRVDALTANLASAQERITTDVEHLRSLILQQGLDQGTVDALVTRLDSINSTVQGIDPDPSFPAAPPAGGGGDTPPTEG